MAATRLSGTESTLGADLGTNKDNGRKTPVSLDVFRDPPASRSRQAVMNRKDSSRETSPSLSRSRTEKFHKLFKSVPDDEHPVDYFSCAFLGDNLLLLHGNLYVSHRWFCFYSRIKARGRLLEIPMDKIISITREKTALIIPNAIGLQTAKEKYVFGSFIARDSTYKFVYSMWKKAQQQNDIELSRNDSTTDLPFTISLDQMISAETEYSLRSGDSFIAQENDLDNNNVISNSSSAGQKGSDHESDSSVCPECGVVDACDTKDKQANQDANGPIYVSADVHDNIRDKKFSIPYFVRCFDSQKIFAAFSQLVVKFQKIPRINLLLAVCTILVLFLLLSAVGLTYKLLVIQAKLEAGGIWSPTAHNSMREKIYSMMYTMQSESHVAAVKQLHTVIESNIKVLDEICMGLKNLQLRTIQNCVAKDDCS